MSLRDHLGSRLAVRVYIVAASLFVLVFAADAFLLPWIIHSRAEISIPDLTGMPLAKAEQALADRGLQGVVGKREPSETVPTGHVMYMDPPPRSIVREGRNVYLTVSGGGEKVTVPNLRGRSLRDVRITLEQMDLRVGMITYQPSELAIETVLSQTIAPGRSVTKQTAIDITLSSGEAAVEVDVPYLIGMSLEQARLTLTDVGLIAGEVSYKSAPGLAHHSVLSQDPAAGTRLAAGSAVALTLVQ